MFNQFAKSSSDIVQSETDLTYRTETLESTIIEADDLNSTTSLQTLKKMVAIEKKVVGFMPNALEIWHWNGVEITRVLLTMFF